MQKLAWLPNTSGPPLLARNNQKHILHLDVQAYSISASFNVRPHWLTSWQHHILLSPRKLQAALAPMALRRRMLWYLKGFVCLCCRCQSEAASADPARALSCGSCGKKMGWQYLPGSGCHDFACLHCGAHASDEETKNEKTWHGVHYFKLQIEILLSFFSPVFCNPIHIVWRCIFPVTLYKIRIRRSNSEFEASSFQTLSSL